MSINGVGESFYQEQMNSRNKVKKLKSRSFDHEFKESYKAKYSEKADSESTANKQVHTEKGFYAGISHVNGTYGTGNISTAPISKAVSECKPENISFADADYVKNCIAEGYTLKAVVSQEENIVYIEQKNEDGTVKAYQVDLSKVEQNTENPIEKAAVESLENKQDKSIDDLWQEAMAEFAAYVKARIKNGPPKFMTGASELSIEEWDKLIGNVDDAIDQIKQEQEQRLEKLKEAEEKKALLESQEANESDASEELEQIKESGEEQL